MAERNRLKVQPQERSPQPAPQTGYQPAAGVLGLQRAAGNRAVDGLVGGGGNGEAPPFVQQAAQDGGQPLDAQTRTEFEAAFGQDLGRVRVHTGRRAAASARFIGAQAYTSGQKIVFSAGRYQPHTPTGKHLLAHELAHVIQNQRQSPTDAVFSQPGDRSEVIAESTASLVSRGVAAPEVYPVATAAIQRSPEKDAIGKHTSWGMLDEETLGVELLALAIRGEYDAVQKVLSSLGKTDRDDVSLHLVKPASDEQIEQMGTAEKGRELLDRLYDELTSGSADDDEKQQAARILKAKTLQINPEDFARSKENAKIFPYRKGGMTVLDDAPIFARLAGKGKVRVKIPVRVWSTEKYRRENQTLPLDVFTRGIDIPENEIVGVRLYDEGGKLVYYPALYLVQLGNETVSHTYQKMAETAGLGLSLGSGAALGAGVKGVTWGARALIYADRAAMVLGAVTVVIDEHRGWFIERFGEDGRAFVDAMDTVNSVVAVYGMGRAVMGMGKLILSLRKSYQKWRSTASKIQKELNEVETARMQQVEDETSNFLKQVEQAEEAQKASKAAAKGGDTVETAADAAENVYDIRTGKPLKDSPDLPVKKGEPSLAEAADQPGMVNELELMRQKKKAAIKKKAVKREATTGRPVDDDIDDVEPVQAMATSKGKPKTGGTGSGKGTSGPAQTGSVTPISGKGGQKAAKPGGPAKSSGPQTSDPNKKPMTPEEAFGELTEEMQLDKPKPPSKKPVDVKKAVKDAEAEGFMKGTKSGTVDAAIHEHADASDIRKAQGTTGKKFQSAHGGPTSALKNVPGYSRRKALTMLLPKNLHNKVFDKHWKDWVINLRKNKITKVPAGEFYDEMVRAVNNIPDVDMPVGKKGVLIDQIRREMFSDLGLKPDDLIDLPYPNVKPGP